MDKITSVQMDATTVEVVEAQIDRLRPIIEAHKGGVEIVSATPESLTLRLKGHCADCAMAPITYGLVLEKYIREALPSLKEVRYTE